MAAKNTGGQKKTGGSRKTAGQRKGQTTAPKSTARAGKTKSTKSRAAAQRSRSASGGTSGNKMGGSRTTGKPARPRRMTGRGPGDVGKAGLKTGGSNPMRP